MQSLLVSSLFVLLVSFHLVVGLEREAKRVTAVLYSELDGKGSSLCTHRTIPYLRSFTFDNKIQSVYQTGMWIYYEHERFNAFGHGFVLLKYGNKLLENFERRYRNKVSSVRLVNSYKDKSHDVITFYKGIQFTDRDLATGVDMPYLGYSMDVSSLIVIGNSPWTIYSKYHYGGHKECVYPETDHYINGKDERIQFGLYPNITNVPFFEKGVQSARKGCW
ncbi:uncharacterized protein LOC123500045 [Portunus trituberculatus]|uniref:uncharacterized protein LOC123500045 n=1 Tax=Portunus trituberculatus TaxID=210409 RepID=UPI001E1D0B1B|nr:uncharacterized protein LOC123500045 [Portunus trituberculatus]